MCLPCWTKVEDFHRFYQSVLVRYEQTSQWQPKRPDKQLADDRDVKSECIEQKYQITLLGIESNEHSISDGQAAAASDDHDDHWRDDGKNEEMDDIKPELKTSATVVSAVPAKRKRGRPRKVYTSSRSMDASALVDTTLDVTGDAQCTHKCENCPEVFNTAKLLASHQRDIHNLDVEARSPDTSQIQPDMGELIKRNGRNSMSQRRNDDELLRSYFSLTCRACGFVCATFAEVRKHQREVHAERVAYVECCDKKFYKKCLALQHCRWHENPHDFE